MCKILTFQSQLAGSSIFFYFYFFFPFVSRLIKTVIVTLFVYNKYIVAVVCGTVYEQTITVEMQSNNIDLLKFIIFSYFDFIYLVKYLRPYLMHSVV